ncbi:MAG: choice-of-anchor C family protein [Burkholderiales bacterium]|nr:choice-of-anchor C family protein [Burkholderiales bacterium]MBK9347556.1 choice-of-anchor C family protein [Burkholderiales bacterium]
MKYINASLAGLALVACAAQAGATELVVNGGFESNTVLSGTFDTFYNATQGLTGWNIDFNSVDLVSSNYWDPAAGVNSLDLNGAKKSGISQILNTVAGQTYNLSFDLAGNFEGSPVIKKMSINIGPHGLYSFDTTGKSKHNMGWEHYTTTFVAQSSSTALSFVSNVPGAYGSALDNISVTAVPEPETYAMLLAGLGVMGAIARRRNNKAA